MTRAEAARSDGAPPSPTAPPAAEDAGFRVRLDIFEGPFDLLLQLIAKRQLDVTEVALSQVTDDFLRHTRALGTDWDLGRTTEFLVVAATLLDLKAARLLPSVEVADPEDLELLEARDLLFARLLQYRAYKEVAAILAERLAAEARHVPRAVGLEPRFAGLLPEVLLGIGPVEFAALAARVLAPRSTPVVSLEHVHAPAVSVREQVALLAVRLLGAPATFRQLIADCATTLEVVARFLALLELYREGQVSFDQVAPLGDLHVRWSGTLDAEAAVTAAGEAADEFDVTDAPRLTSAPHRPPGPAGKGDGTVASDRAGDHAGDHAGDAAADAAAGAVTAAPGGQHARPQGPSSSPGRGGE